MSIKNCTLPNTVTELNLGIRTQAISCGERGLITAMFGIGKKLAEEAVQQAESAAQVTGKYKLLLSLLLCLRC